MSEKNVTVCRYGMVFAAEIPVRMQFSPNSSLTELIERFDGRVRNERKPGAKKMYDAVMKFLNLAKEKEGQIEKVTSSNQPEIAVSFTSKEVAKPFVGQKQIQPERIMVIISLPMPQLLNISAKSFLEAEARFARLRAVSGEYENKLKFKKAETLMEFLEERGARLEWLSMKDDKLFVTASFKDFEGIDIFEKTVERVISGVSLKKS